MNTLTPKMKQDVVNMYIEFTGDTKCEVKQTIRYRKHRGGYFDIIYGEKGAAKRKKLLNMMDEHDEDVERRLSSHPALVKFQEVTGASCIKWNEDVFHVEFKKESTRKISCLK